MVYFPYAVQRAIDNARYATDWAIRNPRAVFNAGRTVARAYRSLPRSRASPAISLAGLAGSGRPFGGGRASRQVLYTPYKLRGNVRVSGRRSTFKARGQGGRFRNRRRTGMRKSRAQRRRQSKYNRKIWAIANPSKQVSSIRSTTSGQITVPYNKPAYHSFYLLNKAEIEAKRLKAQVYIHTGVDTQVNTHPIQNLDVNALRLMSAYTIWSVRNNEQEPVDIQLSYYGCATTCGTGPVDIWAGDIIDRDASVGLTVTNVKESTLFNIREKTGVIKPALPKFWKRFKTKTVRLTGGDEFSFKLLRRKDLDYDELNQENDGSTDYMRQATQCVVLRMMGVVCHDANPDTNVGYASASLDWTSKTVYNWDVNPGSRKYKNYIVDSTDALDAIDQAEIMVDDIQEHQDAAP